MLVSLSYVEQIVSRKKSVMPGLVLVCYTPRASLVACKQSKQAPGMQEPTDWMLYGGLRCGWHGA
jgi:hypothetical protein